MCIYINIIHIDSTHTYILHKQKPLFWVWLIVSNHMTIRVYLSCFPWLLLLRHLLTGALTSLPSSTVSKQASPKGRPLLPPLRKLTRSQAKWIWSERPVRFRKAQDARSTSTSMTWTSASSAATSSKRLTSTSLISTCRRTGMPPMHPT